MSIMGGGGGDSGVQPGDAISAAPLLEHTLEELRRERAARLAAELAADRAARLLDVTAAFSAARAPIDVSNVVLTQGGATLGAQRGLVALVTADGASLEVLGETAHPGAVVKIGQRIPLGDPGPLASAVRAETALFLETSGAAGPAVVALPLLVAGRSLGGLCFTFEGTRRFDGAARALALTLARLCAQALDRACTFEEAAHARAAAEAANRAKDEFLSTLSHELRTPLMSILGWANILRTRKLEPEAVARALATVERSARTQSQLVEDILDVSRIDAQKLRLEIRTIDPAAIMRAAIEVVRPSADGKQIAIEAAIDDCLGPMRADPGRLQQIAWNLLANAVKFTPKGGRVEVRLSLVDDGLRLRVIDSGQGISPELLPHVFERFRQGDSTRSHGGLGLGLAIARHLVELHSGTITAESAGPGRGATFTVTLPMPPTLEGDPSVAELTPMLPQLDKLRVLVVDDEPDTLELIAGILRGQGASVVVAASAQEALRAVELALPDVLIADLGLPQQGGHALLQRVRALAAEQRRQVPALALTTRRGALDAKVAEHAGFQRSLAKPFTPIPLIDEVWQLAGLRAGGSLSRPTGGRFT